MYASVQQGCTARAGTALLLRLPGIWLVKQLAAIAAAAAVTYKSHTHQHTAL